MTDSNVIDQGQFLYSKAKMRKITPNTGNIMNLIFL